MRGCGVCNELVPNLITGASDRAVLPAVECDGNRGLHAVGSARVAIGIASRAYCIRGGICNCSDRVKGSVEERTVIPAVRAHICATRELDLRVDSNGECTLGRVHPVCVCGHGKKDNAAFIGLHFKIDGCGDDSVRIRHKGSRNEEYFVSCFIAYKSDTFCTLVKLSSHVFTSKCEGITIDCTRLLNNDVFLYATSFHGILIVRIGFNVGKCDKIGCADASLVFFVKMGLHTLIFVFFVLFCANSYFVHTLLN